MESLPIEVHVSDCFIAIFYLSWKYFTIAMLSIPVVRSCGNKCFSSVNFVTFNHAQWNEEPPVGVTVIGLRRKMNFGTETISKSHQKWIVCINHPPTARLSLGLPHDWQQPCCPYFIIYIYDYICKQVCTLMCTASRHTWYTLTFKVIFLVSNPTLVVAAWNAVRNTQRAHQWTCWDGERLETS